MATRVMRVCAVLALAAAPLAAQQDDPVIDAGASPHSIRQWIAVGESEAGVDDGGPVIGDERQYSGAGTRAPN